MRDYPRIAELVCGRCRYPPSARKGVRLRKRVVLVAICAMVGGLSFAPPALAHGGHRSCGEGAHIFVVPIAQSGGGGEFASSAARQGGLADETEQAHAALCDPAP